VIVEGRAFAEKRRSVLQSLREKYTTKYGYTPDWTDPRKEVVYRVEPRVVHAWRAPRIHQSIVRFVF